MRFVIFQNVHGRGAITVNAARVTHASELVGNSPTTKLTFDHGNSIVVSGDLEDVTKLLAGERE